MSTHRSIEKWGPVVLGGVCIFVVIKLVRELNGSPAPASRTYTLRRQAKPTAGSRRGKGEGIWSAGAVTLHLDQLKAAQAGSAPAVERNPFGYPPPPPPPGADKGGKGSGAPLPPPPIPLEALGYSQDQAGNRQAYLTDQDEVFAVHVGDEISNRYKILSISPGAVRVVDTTSGEQATLPIPRTR